MDSGPVTALLLELRSGNKNAEAALFALVYQELHKLAAKNMAQERAGHILQTTALVHEAYLRLVRQQDIQFATRSHFFAVAAQTMRRILVDDARARHAAKRGGGHLIPSVSDIADLKSQPPVDVMALDDALDRLSEFDARQAKVVEMRFFAGMNEEEIAEVLGISSRTVKRDWTLARAWLYGELRP